MGMREYANEGICEYANKGIKEYSNEREEGEGIN